MKLMASDGGVWESGQLKLSGGVEGRSIGDAGAGLGWKRIGWSSGDRGTAEAKFDVLAQLGFTTSVWNHWGLDR